MKKQLKIIGIGHMAVLLLAIILMIAAYAIPMERIKVHVGESIPQLMNEGEYPDIFESKIGRLDNFTDTLMLSTAITSCGNPFRDAFKTASYASTGDESIIDALNEQVSGAGNIKIKVKDYARYWHGYLIFLRPILYLFNLQEAEMLIQLVFGALFGIVFALLFKNCNWKVAVSFGISMLLVCVHVVPYSLQFMNMFLLSLTGMLIMLLFYDKIQRKNGFFLFFWIMGMLTSFFDLLTTPILVFGMLLILKVILDQEKTTFFETIMQGICWGAGYLSMWLAKWLIGSIVLQKNVLESAVDKIATRTGGDVQGIEPRITDVIDVLGILYSNPFMKKMLLIALAFIVVIGCITVAKTQKTVIFKNARRYSIILLISCAPLVWFALLRNHTYIHFWFTYRNLAVFFWGILVYASFLSSPVKETHG